MPEPSVDPPRRLVLVRHAKSDQAVGGPDHDRPLNARGRRDAPELGRWIRDRVGVVDRVLCSSALRAQETWRLADVPGVLQVLTGLYLASPAQVLTQVGEVGGDVRYLVVVGHEPTLSQVAGVLAGPGSDPTARALLADGFVTSAVAVLELTGEWGRLGPAGARLVAFGIPRS
jgi:phosphohistidine phosphatase